jgi:antitoxin component YwqK of YwqJK toxin-antitoxin module
MNMGTGVTKQWYPNGQLQYEMTTIGGIPNGRQPLWDTAGNLVSETFLLKGKPVSKKRYDAACAKNLDLPRY